MKVETVLTIDPPPDTGFHVMRCTHTGCTYEPPYSDMEPSMFRRGSRDWCESLGTIHARDYRHTVVIEHITEGDA